MFSQTVEYALRAVVLLAHRHPQPQTTAQISEITKVPQPYLSKVMQSLRRAGVVNSQRGVGGGISLVKTPQKLTILEVVNSVDPIQRINSCPLGIKSHGNHLCPLHKQLDDSLAEVEKVFSNITLQDMLLDPDRVPLCQDGEEPLVMLDLNTKK